MAQRYCCPECFGDPGLRDSIFPSLSPKRGPCSFCETEDALLVEPRQLANWFEILVNVYEPNDKGLSLVEWMKNDWMLFSHPRMDIAHAKELLSEILDNGEIVRQSFTPSPIYSNKSPIEWDLLRDEMMHTNRWFLDKPIDLDRLRELLDLLLAPKLPSQWFRARIRTDDKVFTIAEMNAPPKHLASHGRANPAGIPYLYLGSKQETAVAEIRPHTGEVACVAEFTILEIRAVDLRHPRKSVSPFILTDSNEIGQLRADLPFLERLGDELTRPVLPSRTAIDYIPSQYLCEFIKKSGFNGVVYRSSVSDGINLALFHPSNALGISVLLFNVTKVSVEIGPS